MIAETIIGIIGMVFILAAFILIEVSGYLTRDSKWYNIMNILGSVFLIFYAYALSSWPFLILNAVWAMTALWKLYTILIKRFKTTGSVKAD